jgi:hypothetical protein
MNFHYKPPETVRAMMLGTGMVRGIIGPLGSGKTTGCLFELFRRAREQAPNQAGIRATRFAIIRNTLAQLKQTVLADIKAYFGDVAHWKVTDNTVYFSFGLKDGTRVASEWLLIPLETPDDVRRLLSLQLTGAFVEEFREVNFEIISSLIGRLGRYPRLGATPTWEGLVMSSNPYPDGSPWFEAFEVKRPNGWQLFRQPSGLSPKAENVEHLPDGYYDRLCEGAAPEWIKVHVHGMNGSDRSGQAVFGDSFIYEFHTRPYLHPIENRQFVLGMDLDRNPAALICQMDSIGRMLVHKEVYAEGVGLENFVRGQLTPTMYESFRGNCYILADPSGVRRSSISEESSFGALERLGYTVVAAPTNDVEPRLRSLEALFAAQIGGEAAILISRAGCPMLIRALSSAYKFKRQKNGNLENQPEKQHPWSDLADALQYASFMGSSKLMGRPLRGMPGWGRVGPRPPAVSSLAWT